ncbi:hypothetical protein Tco_0950217 [Tanacetum coccineum]
MHVYLTSNTRDRFKAMLVFPNGRNIRITGQRWTKLCVENLSTAKMVHFIEQGDDTFYVTGYDENGFEYGGYNVVRTRPSRIMTRVWPYADYPQAIKASFLANHPMHQHRKVLVKHQGIQYEMKMKMDYHKEKPERTNHVGIYGKWKQFGRECGFKHDKMLRIHYIGTARQLDSYDEEDEILIFHVC